MKFPALLVLVLLLAASAAIAQNVRSGIRISYTQIDRQSGTTGSAFLPVSSREVTIERTTPENACGAARAVSITGNLPRGPIRRVRISFTTNALNAIPLSPRGCPRAWVETTLADGTILAGGHGEVRVTQFGDATHPLRGTFSQTADRGGVPTTIRGEFTTVLPAPP